MRLRNERAGHGASWQRPDPFAYEREPRRWAKIKAPVSDSRAAAVGRGKEGIRPILGNDLMETTLYF
jgi:hypothetical protein